MDSAPEVTGVSPCEGYPNTKIKIWGENMGMSAPDVTSVLICGGECIESLEWISERKIICHSGLGCGRGRIIVSTITGGSGTCSVYFTGMEHSAPQSPRLDPQSESNMWVEEDWNLFDDFGSGNQPLLSESLPQKKVDPLGVRRGMSGKMSEENVRQLCPNGSGNLLSENFNPVMYLLENHCSTTFSQLKDGLDNLRTEVEHSAQAPGEFIRDNLDSFIQCFDTLSDVNTLLIRNESETESGTITAKVEHLLDDTTIHADALFQGLIKRKMKADATRNALTVLQRYRFLFNLPRSIEKNIRHREYEIVTNDYERAKSLFSGTKVKVFAKVLKEVESLVAKLRADLKKQLLQNPSTLEEQKKLVKYLLDLDYLGDPAWECIVQMNLWILDLLKQCKDKYQSGDVLLEDAGLGHERTLSNVSHSSFSSGMHSKMLDPFIGGGVDHNKPKRILFVEELIDIAGKTLPNLCRLGHAYFNRTLFTTMLSENQDSIISDNTANKGEAFDEMVVEICEIFTDMVNAALFEDALEKLPEKRVKKLGEWKQFEDSLVEGSGAWLPLCVRKIRSCLGALQSLHLPPNPLSLVQQLAINVRMLCSDTLFLRTNKDVELLHEREDWQVQEEEGSIITSLPILFENIVVDVLLTLKEIVIENHFGETEEHQALLEGAVYSFQVLLEDFTHCLDRLAFQNEENDSSREATPHETALTFTSSEDTLNKPSVEERLLLIVSNCSYTERHVAPELFDCFVSHGYPECEAVAKEFRGLLGELEMKVFQAYIERKMEPLMAIVSQGMNSGYFQWDADTPPTGIRSYMKEVLLYLVHVHAEVQSISPEVVPRVLSQILEILTAELLKELNKVESFSKQGKLHVFIELKTLEEIVAQYHSDITRETFLNLYELVGTSDKKLMKVLWGITDSFKECTCFQFKCLQIPKPSSRV